MFQQRKFFQKQQTYVLVDNGENEEQYPNFQRIRLLGKGAFGQVWLIQDENGNQFAEKIVHPKKKTLKEAQQMRQEVQILKQLNHPNIVTLHEAYLFEDGSAHLILEHLEGGNLSEFIQERKKNNQKITDFEKNIILKQIFLALQYIHSQGIIHRDLKLENILFKEKNSLNGVKIADFGISSKFQDHIGVQSSQKAAGTPIFMAPEIFHNETYTKAVDIWSCGIIFFMLCSNGRHPFINTADHKSQKINKLLKPMFQFPSERHNTMKINSGIQLTHYNFSYGKIDCSRINNQDSIKSPLQLIKRESISTSRLSILMPLSLKKNNKSIKEMIAELISPKIKETEPIKENFTLLAIDLIKKMCTYDPWSRYTIEQILQHPWITRSNPWKTPLTMDEQFQAFSNSTKFLQYIIAIAIIKNQKYECNKSPLLQRQSSSLIITNPTKIINKKIIHPIKLKNYITSTISFSTKQSSCNNKNSIEYTTSAYFQNSHRKLVPLNKNGSIFSYPQTTKNLTQKAFFPQKPQSEKNINFSFMSKKSIPNGNGKRNSHFLIKQVKNLENKN